MTDAKREQEIAIAERRPFVVLDNLGSDGLIRCVAVPWGDEGAGWAIRFECYAQDHMGEDSWLDMEDTGELSSLFYLGVIKRLLGLPGAKK